MPDLRAAAETTSEMYDDFFNVGLSRPLFGLFSPFSWYIARLKLTNFTMINEDRKKE